MCPRTSPLPSKLGGVTCEIPEPEMNAADGQAAQTPLVPPVQSTRIRPSARTFAELTTIGVGGPVQEVRAAHSEAEVVEAVREADAQGTPVLVLGGGSNVLADDAPWNGVVVRDMRRGITLQSANACAGANFRVLPGTPWDEFVVEAIKREWTGVEALSGIPGVVGAAPVQNIGAYGQEVAAVVASVRVYDRATGNIRTLFSADLNFGYRNSLLKETLRTWGPSPRYIVLAVDFQTGISALSEPIRYQQLATTLGVELGARVPMREVRSAVLEVRRAKGMVLDDADRDTYSLGSFFTNPVMTTAQAAKLPETAPRYEVHDTEKTTFNTGAPVHPGLVKTSAAWLIEHAGFGKGYGQGQARLSTRHTLALTNRGQATAADIRALAREIQAGVEARFGVHLEPEPVVLGGEL